MLDPEVKQKLLEQLEDIPIISVAAKRAGVSKATVYRWKAEDKGFAKEVSQALKVGRDGLVDLAEGKLIAAVQKGEKWAILTILESHADRYYKPRKAKAIEPGYKGIAAIHIHTDPVRIPAPGAENLMNPDPKDPTG